MNILVLVKHGFSREEVYFMPIGEMLDYIKLISRIKKEEEMEMLKANNQSSFNESEMHYAGKTVPGMF